MLETLNRYCSNCLATERFLVLGATLVCPRCSKRLERTPSGDDPAADRPAAPVLRHPASDPARERGRDPQRQAG
ncbi:MAG: hypothetical protein HMLKMBBP_02410 [Planctomycetes bacterium]|nr:hypothetical protein [Planctomycetota bacterium]